MEHSYRYLTNKLVRMIYRELAEAILGAPRINSWHQNCPRSLYG